MKKIIRLVLVSLFSLTLFSACGNLENGTPEEITVYIFKELAKTNKDNVKHFAYANKESVLKDFDRISRYSSSISKDLNAFEVKILKSEEMQEQHRVEITIRNKSANDDKARYRKFIGDRENTSDKYDLIFSYIKENGKWKVYFVS